MKNELKISTLSIVCVLCAAIAVPASGATAVRSLGGAGTYSGTSSAVTAKTGTSSTTNAKSAKTATTGVASSVRGGAMRLGGGVSSGGTRTAASRVSATPRLSIGKYLATSSAPDKTVINNSATSGNLQTRIEVLEQWMGYQENSDNNIPAQFEALDESVSDLQLQAEKLAADIEMVSGKHTTVDYANKVLTVVQDDVTKTYDLAVDFAGKSEFDALQAALNDVTGGLDNFATKVALNDLKTALQNEIATKQVAGDYAAAADLSDLQKTVEDLQGTSATGADLSELAAQVKVIADDYAKKTELTATQTALQSAIDELEGLVATETLLRENADKALDDKIAAMDLAYKAADDEIKAGYAAADTALDGKISANAKAVEDEVSARETADTQIRADFATADAEVLAGAKKYTDDEIAELTDSLGGATADLSALTGRVDTAEGKISTIEGQQTAQDGKISDLETMLSADGATGKAIAAAQAQADKGVADAATVAGALDDYKLLNDAAVTGAQDSADAAQLAADAAQAQADKGVADAASAAAAAKAAADAAKSAQNLADTNAAELMTLHAVAKSGSYTDLEDVPVDLVTDSKLDSVRDALQTAIDGKQQAGDYAQAAALQELQETVEGLSGGASATVGQLQDQLEYLEDVVESIETTYATNDSVSVALEQVRKVIDGIDAELETLTKTEDLGALAYKDKVEANFINMELPSGTMAMLQSNGDTASWVTVSVVEGQ